MTHIPKTPVRTCLALLGMAPLCRAAYMPTPDEIVAIQKTAFQNREPEAIARFLRHPDEFTQKAAVAALADNPDAAIPLVEKLLADTNPWIRAGAVDVLAEILRRAEKEKMKQLDDIPFNRGWVEAYRRISEEDTAEEILALRLLNEHLSGETGDPVLHSICLLFRQARFPPDAMRPFVDLAAQSPNPTVWQMALYAFFAENSNPNELMRTILAVLERVDPATNPEMLLMSLMLRKAAEGEHAREVLPVAADHLLNKVNGSESPIRKKAWAQVVDRYLEIIEKQWNDETERSPDVVPALCRAVVRLPYVTSGKQGQGLLRARSKALLERCGPGSAPVIRAWADKEEAWLASASDEEIKRVLDSLRPSRFDLEKERENCRESIRYLRELADTIKAGRPANSKGSGE